MAPLEPDFYDSFRVVVNLARNRGLNLAEILNDHGMLRTKEKIKRDQLIALRSLHDRLDAVTPEAMALLNRHFSDLTPADMLRMTKEWVQAFIRLWEES
jgi:hypothetical protein